MILLLHSESIASQGRFSQHMCQSQSFECRVIQSNETWDSLFPNPEVQDIVRGEMSRLLSDRIRWEHVAAFEVLSEPFRYDERGI